MTAEREGGILPRKAAHGSGASTARPMLPVYREQALMLCGDAVRTLRAAKGPLAGVLYRKAAALFREAAEFAEKAAKECSDA